MKTFVCGCLIMISAFTPGVAQPEESSRANTFYLGLGYQGGYFKDINFSPLNYQSSGAAFALGYQRDGNKLLWNVRLGVSLATLSTEVSDFLDTDLYCANLGVGLLKKLNPTANKFTVALGGQYHTYLDVSFFEGTEAITFFATHGLDVAAVAAYQINDRQRLRAFFAIPVLGLLVRPPYTGWNKEISENPSVPVVLTDGRWTSLNDYFGLHMNITYHYQLTPTWALLAQSQLRYYQTRQLKLARHLTHQLLVGVAYQF